MISKRTERVLIAARAKALGAPAPDLIAVRDVGFHAELLAESAVRMVRFILAQQQRRQVSQVIMPRLVTPTVQRQNRAQRRRRRPTG